MSFTNVAFTNDPKFRQTKKIFYLLESESFSAAKLTDSEIYRFQRHIVVVKKFLKLSIYCKKIN